MIALFSGDTNGEKTGGELRQRPREGQEDQLGALGLVVNIIILWNTLHLNAALKQIQAEGYPIQPVNTPYALFFLEVLSPIHFKQFSIFRKA